MIANVYIVVTYHRHSCGDLIEAFGTESEAIAHLRDYAAEFWDNDRLGPLPSTCAELRRAWDEHDLWGSYESRWEFEVREIGITTLQVRASVE